MLSLHYIPEVTVPRPQVYGCGSSSRYEELSQPKRDQKTNADMFPAFAFRSSLCTASGAIDIKQRLPHAQ